MTDRMVGSWEMPESIPLKFLSFAKAYLDSAIQLCDRLCETPQESSFPRGSVILFLVFHSIELFLKAAIIMRSPNQKLHHDIECLMLRYDKLFPEPEFSWNIPFKTEYLGLEPQQIKEKNKIIKPDQLHRYPTDSKLKEWPVVSAFNPFSFSCDIKAVVADFSRLEPIIFTSNKEIKPNSSVGG